MKHRERDGTAQSSLRRGSLAAIVLVILFPVALLAFSLTILHQIDERFTDLNLSGSLRYRALLLYISATADTGVDSKAQMRDIARILARLRASFPSEVAKTDAARQAIDAEMVSQSQIGLETALRFRSAADTLTSDIEHWSLGFTRRTLYIVCAGVLFFAVWLFVAIRSWRVLSSAQRALRASEERFAAFMEKGPAVCYVKDEHGAYVYLNQQWANQFGTNKEDWIGRTDQDLFPEEIARMFRENDLAVLKSGVTSVVTEVAPAADGSTTYWLSYKFPLQDEGGRSYVAGMSVNVTEQKRVETELGLSEERYRDLIESTSDLVQSVGPDGQFLFVNQAWRETLGYTEAELAGRSFFEIVDPDRRDECRDMFHQIFAGKIGLQIETIFVTSGGSKINVEGTSDCEIEGGHAVSIRSIFRNITARKQAEAEREKLVQELRATIASVKELGGLLPICASCKRIRDDDGRWHRLETFITAHSRAEFSHGICPECAVKLYPERTQNKG